MKKFESCEATLHGRWFVWKEERVATIERGIGGRKRQEKMKGGQRNDRESDRKKKREEEEQSST